MAKSNKEWEKSKAEKYAENYWTKNGYTFTVKRKYISKTIYMVSKDGIEMRYDIAGDTVDNKGNMKFFEKSFELHKKCMELEEK